MSGEPIEPMIALQVLIVTNKVLGPKSQLFRKYHLMEPLSSKPRGEENTVRCQLLDDQLTTHPNFLV